MASVVTFWAPGSFFIGLCSGTDFGLNPIFPSLCSYPPYRFFWASSFPFLNRFKVQDYLWQSPLIHSHHMFEQNCSFWILSHILSSNFIISLILLFIILYLLEILQDYLNASISTANSFLFPASVILQASDPYVLLFVKNATSMKESSELNGI